MEVSSKKSGSDRNCGESTAARDSLGRFGQGNPGRKLGTRNKATMAILSILEKDAIKLGKKAVEMALAGDNTALKLCLERLAPPSRERSLQINIPLPQSPADVPETLRAILQSTTDGSITISEAERPARCVEVFARAYELADFDARLKALEARDA